MPFQLNTSKLFLTYPECPLSKEEALECLESILPDSILEYIIAQEKHANGNYHIHVYLSLSTGYRTRNPGSLDLLSNGNRYHGNYQGCRSEKNVIKYCSKEEDYISNFDLNSRLKNKSAHKKILGDALIKRQKSLVDVVNENPEMIFGYKRLKLDLEEYFHDLSDQRQQLPRSLPNGWGQILPTDLQGKKRHYWIFSRGPNKGKTTTAKGWRKDYKCHIQCGDFTYWGINGQEELLVLDEYNSAKLKVSDLNSMADGTYDYRVFQGGVRGLECLIIILSNQPISSLYPNFNVFLYERFNEIELL